MLRGTRLQLFSCSDSSFRSSAGPAVAVHPHHIPSTAFSGDNFGSSDTLADRNFKGLFYTLGHVRYRLKRDTGVLERGLGSVGGQHQYNQPNPTTRRLAAARLRLIARAPSPQVRVRASPAYPWRAPPRWLALTVLSLITTGKLNASSKRSRQACNCSTEIPCRQPTLFTRKICCDHSRINEDATPSRAWQREQARVVL